MKSYKIVIRDDFRERVALINVIIKFKRLTSASSCLDFLLIEFFKRRKDILSKSDLDILFSIENNFSKRKRKVISHMAYSGANIRSKIKDMLLKGVDPSSIVESANADIKANNFNRLAKSEIDLIKKNNKVAVYQRLIAALQEQGLKKFQVKEMTFFDLMNLIKQSNDKKVLINKSDSVDAIPIEDRHLYKKSSVRIIKKVRSE